MNENSLTSSKSACGAPLPGRAYECLRKAGPFWDLTAAIAAELMIGFWFGIGAILAIKMVSSLEELIRR